jgi:hypothetical protein
VTNQREFGYVSVIGFSYLYPLMDLLDKLLLLEGSPNEVQASERENGYASAIIVMSVLMVESAIARVKLDMNVTKPKSALQFMKSKFQHYAGLPILEELFVIRDAIVHNHLWQAKITWDQNRDMKLLSAAKWEGSGDTKLSSVLDPNTRRTKILGLNLFPTRIAKDDAILVMRKSTEILHYIEVNGSNLVDVSNQYVEFRGQLVGFLDLVSSL